MDEAHALNRELTMTLVKVGQQAGFHVLTEYPLPGGRLDVAWCVTVPVPGIDRTLPVVGFEIESSWRTRKHVKGDLLNLFDAGVSLGVIVLAGETNRDEPLRTFAQALVNRPGPKILIWTADDVRALASTPAALPQADEAAQTGHADRPVTVAAGKYDALTAWLSQQPDDRHELRATFGQIEAVLGFSLPASSRSHLPHWYGTAGSAVARAIHAAGWKASQVNLTAETLVLLRT